MAIRYIEGFDNYLNVTDFHSNSIWQGGNGFSAGRFGGQCVGFSSANPVILFPPSGPSSTFTIGFAVNNNTTDSRDWPFTFHAMDIAGTTQINITISLAGLVTVLRANSVALGSFTIPNFDPLSYYYIEFQGTISATVGTAIVAVEGVTYLNLTGQNTKGSGANTTVAQFYWTKQNSVVGALLDDVYYDDSLTLHGPRRVRTGYASANSAVTWTPLASTNVSQISEAHMDSDTTYNSTTGVGNVDLFTTGTYIGAATVVDAVQMRAAFRKDDVNPHVGATVLTSGATTTVGTGLSLTTSYVYVNDIYLTDPNTGSAWTPANANGVSIGYKMVS